MKIVAQIFFAHTTSKSYKKCCDISAAICNEYHVFLYVFVCIWLKHPLVYGAIGKLCCKQDCNLLCFDKKCCQWTLSFIYSVYYFSPQMKSNYTVLTFSSLTLLLWLWCWLVGGVKYLPVEMKAIYLRKTDIDLNNTAHAW